MTARILTLVLAILSAVLSGCVDSNEPERMLYINGVGVDFKDGKYEVYVQLVSFANTANSEQPIDIGAVQAEVGHATGNTMDEALFELYHSVDQKLFWGHLSYIVASEDVMVKGKLSPVIDSFIRYKETRYQIWLYTTKDPVQDVLLLRPVLNKSITLSKLGDPKNSYEQESFIQPLNIRQLLIGLDEPGHEAMIPLISVEENWKSMQEPIKAPVLSGVGVITPTSFKGFISGDKARGIQWMSNNTKRGQVTFKLDGGNYFTMIIDKVKVKIKPITGKGEVKFDINVDLSATVSEMGKDITTDRIRKEIEKVVESEIKETYEDALTIDVDIYHLSEKLYRKNVKEWKKHHKEGKLELTEDSIRNLKVRVTKLSSDRKSYKETIER
ncbi:Ger(x)C family spore germination protein [Sporosarcina sp. P1]|uniref:Ger(x)C family spore germination protein n=1 Tax=Sporosarcina sp. P1 TaxID=2048257 RepID=UPI000C1632F5|nr:Ger(x)C family spore germination protein [Sporosarcina sp. P1]PIC84145.1 spore gernimation protein [Sporosarcina sp. P1]